ncbi:MAG: 3-hydroxyacyl-CoA dehydrogenase [Phycisphaeraceae bacterium]|nr:3-hydroxyacyl-CoA dehydrogenase [Phycisphaeraceae bacterium]
MTFTTNSVTVIGSGFMGNQIALHCAAHGKSVWMHDTQEEAIRHSAEETMPGFLDRMIADGSAASDDRQSILDRVRRTTDLRSAVSDSVLVIEAVREDLDAKRELFGELDRLCPAETILATNSSSIRASRIESATARPERVLNTHFVQPIWRHPFVELMRGHATSDATLQAVRAFMASIQVIPVVVRKESTGFIFNRMWRALKKEALRVVDQGIAGVEDVDRTWMIQMETPMGPLGLMDIIGLDVVRDIELVYHEESGDPSDLPPKILLDKIARGHLGEKTGQGFYSYPNPAWKEPEFLKPASP